MDLSELDKKYFIDEHKYNCPFCKRNHVSYDLIDADDFDWTDKKKCYVYFVRCNSCQKISLHFTFKEIRVRDQYGRYGNDFAKSADIDGTLFFSQPSSFFVLDERIPHEIRELIFEAEKSRQANLLVGASACIRKAIYELLVREKTIVKNDKTGHADYKESIKNLKTKSQGVAPELFDALGDIQEMASDNVHEGSWEAWDSPKLKFLIELTKATLHEMYVVPEERKNRLGALSQMKSVFVNSKTPQKEDTNQKEP
jgi:transcription elongation factor Elf1